MRKPSLPAPIRRTLDDFNRSNRGYLENRNWTKKLRSSARQEKSAAFFRERKREKSPVKKSLCTKKYPFFVIFPQASPEPPSVESEPPLLTRGLSCLGRGALPPGPLAGPPSRVFQLQLPQTTLSPPTPTGLSTRPRRRLESCGRFSSSVSTTASISSTVRLSRTADARRRTLNNTFCYTSQKTHLRSKIF